MRVVDLWIRLPFIIVEAGSVNSFERRLDKTRKDQSAYYSYRKEMNPTGHDPNILSDSEEKELGQQVPQDLLPERICEYL